MKLEQKLQANARDLELELTWFSKVVAVSFKQYFDKETTKTDIKTLAPPELKSTNSYYAQIIKKHEMSFSERFCLILGMVPHLRPNLLNIFRIKDEKTGRNYPEFGGIEDANGDFFPTVETLVFILAGKDLSKRFSLLQLLNPNHFFTKENILELRVKAAGQTPLKAPLRLMPDIFNYLTTGEIKEPHFSSQFPARRIETQLEWRDLVLHPSTLSRVNEIKSWIEHGDTLLYDWAMASKIRPGYRALFYGPPGTGKSMTACLIGKATGYKVYRIDLSSVVSKYIGETEKNLERIFSQAENKKWVLFFDEADALFGKRSETRGAHDRYANQEVSYLLQRIEVFNGIAILASNHKDNIDKAFARRFEAMIYFPMPSAKERKLLWEKGFSKKAQLERAINMTEIARNFELSGGSIINVIRFVSLKALASGKNTITKGMLLQGIKRELGKEGRMV